ncbi:MAG TPA: hypothetical protein VM933_08210 [Acidimicrobiales bacterium]|nr:hypothetical protein [Acidimicrobiales bacterium]
MADLADHAYALAGAALGGGPPAVEVAITAVRRGGRSRSAVLGHARAEALGRAVDAPVTDLDAAVPDDLSELAVALAGTRPPVERVVVDLDTRHGLDRTALGRALGTSTADAAARAAEVAEGWQRALDPVLLARFGPGGCDGLAAALGLAGGSADEPPGPGSDPPEVPEIPGAVPGGEPPAATLRELLALGASVTDHAAGCEACTDRLRSMVSVRTLLGRRSLDPAPHAVRAAAAPSRLRRPTPPPPLEPERTRRRGLRPALAALAAVAVLVAGVVGVTALRSSSNGDDADMASVEALTLVPEAGNVLVAAPAAVEGRAPEPVRLTNRSEADITWLAAPDVPWLSVRPAEGTLQPGASTVLRLVVSSDAPEGDVRGAVQITGRDGSATVVRVATTIERPPDLAATAEGCDVRAMVEDEGEVAAVQLHWFDPPGTPGGRPTERISAMSAGDAGWLGRLPGGFLPLTWWVTAVDARGNGARTADGVLPAATC